MRCGKCIPRRFAARACRNRRARASAAPRHRRRDDTQLLFAFCGLLQAGGGGFDLVRAAPISRRVARDHGAAIGPELARVSYDAGDYLAAMGQSVRAKPQHVAHAGLAVRRSLPDGGRCRTRHRQRGARSSWWSPQPGPPPNAPKRRLVPAITAADRSRCWAIVRRTFGILISRLLSFSLARAHLPYLGHPQQRGLILPTHRFRDATTIGRVLPICLCVFHRFTFVVVRCGNARGKDSVRVQQSCEQEPNRGECVDALNSGAKPHGQCRGATGLRDPLPDAGAEG
jgi:hypothetical protein